MIIRVVPVRSICGQWYPSASGQKISCYCQSNEALHRSFGASAASFVLRVSRFYGSCFVFARLAESLWFVRNVAGNGVEPGLFSQEEVTHRCCETDNGSTFALSETNWLKYAVKSLLYSSELDFFSPPAPSRKKVCHSQYVSLLEKGGTDWSLT